MPPQHPGFTCTRHFRPPKYPHLPRIPLALWSLHMAAAIINPSGCVPSKGQQVAARHSTTWDLGGYRHHKMHFGILSGQISDPTHLHCSFSLGVCFQCSRWKQWSSSYTVVSPIILYLSPFTYCNSNPRTTRVVCHVKNSTVKDCSKDNTPA